MTCWVGVVVLIFGGWYWRFSPAMMEASHIFRMKEDMAASEISSTSGSRADTIIATAISVYRARKVLRRSLVASAAAELLLYLRISVDAVRMS